MIPVYVDPGFPEGASSHAFYAACTQVVAPESCTQSSRDAAIARIVWRTPLRAQIEIERPPTNVQRTIDFRDVDLPDAKWQAVGLLVGALLREFLLEPRSSTPTPPPGSGTGDRIVRSLGAPQMPRGKAVGSQPARVTPRPASPHPGIAESEPEPLGRKPIAPVPSAGIEGWVALGGLAGSGLVAQGGQDGGHGRAGGWFEVGASVWQGLGLAGSAQFSQMLGELAGVSGGWLSAGVGPSMVWRPADEKFALTLRVLAAREELRLRFGGQNLARAYWSLGASVGLESALTRSLALTAGLHVSQSPGQPVKVDDASIASNPKVAPSILLGVKFWIVRGGVPVF